MRATIDCRPASIPLWNRAPCAALLFIAAGCSIMREPTYLERRAAFQTTLLNPGPAPPVGEYPGGARPWLELFGGSWEFPAERVREVSYPSGELSLKAWVYTPPGAERQPAPALLYLHPGVGGAGASWVRDTRPFLQAGFIVMLPTFRGEMGNPGSYEFAMGEVDDAKSAAHWLASQPIVDKGRIYAFGWSYGGMISALLSLMDDVPLRHTASSGSLITGIVLENDMDLPFDRTNTEEVGLRSLVGNLRWMKRRHYAYMGSADSYFVPAIVAAKQEMTRTPHLLRIIMVPGEHMGAGVPAVVRYFNLVQREPG